MADKKSDPTPEAEVAADVQPTDDLGAKVDAAISRWMQNHIYDSAVARSVEAINHVRSSLGDLRDEILQVVK